MTLHDFYAALGGDSRQVLDRLLSESMVRRFLHRFPDDPSYSELKAALAASDFSTAFRAAHTLKGTAATLGLDALSVAASELTEALRGASTAPKPGLVAAVDAAYRHATESIGLLDA